MNYKFFKILFFFLIIGCTQNNVNTNLTINPIFDQKYKNKGFGLVYNLILKKKKKFLKKLTIDL